MMIEIDQRGRPSVGEETRYFGLRVKRGCIHICQRVEDWRSQLLTRVEDRKSALQSVGEKARRDRLETEIDEASRKAGEFNEAAPELLQQAQERWVQLPEVSGTGEKIASGATQLGKLGGEIFMQATNFIWMVGSGVGQGIRVATEKLVILLKNLRSRKNG